MKIILQIILTFTFLMNLSPEVIIKRDSSILKGKIIKMDEDTITVISSNNEMILDKEDISKIYYSEKKYEEEIANKNKPPEEDTDNLIKNGDFNDISTMSNWKILSNSNLPYFYYIQNGELIFKTDYIMDNGSIMLIYNSFPLEKGARYSIKFNAKASQKLAIDIIIEQKDQPNNKFYIKKRINLDTEMKEFEYSFRMKNNTEQKSQLKFITKMEHSQIYFDNIEIKKL